MTPFSFPLDRPDVHLSSLIPDHAAALAEIFRRYADQLDAGRSAEDVANELLPVVRVAARRT